MNLEVGSIIGDYQVIAILGAGGMGKVYKVRNTISDRIEALKVLLPDLATEPELADRFLREIKVQASLEHPNIAGLHTAVRVENQLLMLMECVEGVTLEQRLAGGPLPVAQAVDYIRQVLAALEYAHGRGVIHRDIKPANMMLTPAGVVKLMDFGIAKAANDRRLTMTGTTMGSLYYMSPEQIQGSCGLDARADLYSLGVSLYELSTGKRPFDGESQFAIMSAHLGQDPVPPIQLDPTMPPLLNDVILMSVLKDPNARFQTASAFRNALGAVAAQLAPVAPVVPMPTKTMAAPPPQQAAQAPVQAAAATAPAPSKRGLWMGLGAVAAVLAVVAVIELGPRLGTKAAPGAVAPVQQGQMVPSPSTPAQTTPAQSSPSVPDPQTAPSQPVQQQPQQASTPAATNPVHMDPRLIPDPQTPSRPAEVAGRARQQAPVTPPEVRQEPAPPPVQQPVQQQPAQQQAVQQAPANAANTANNAKVRAELEDVRQQVSMLAVRANAVRSGVQRLDQNAAAYGGANVKFTGPRDLMNNFLDEANNAMAAGDPVTAKSMMEKAERQVEILEKLLGHR